MLLFSTILDINKSMTKDDFIKLVLEWNENSPHESNIIPDIQWNGERTVHYGNERLWLDIVEYRNQNTIAVRYEKIEADGVVWDTDYVMNFNDRKMSIRLDRSYLEEALTIDPKFSTPYFISLLLERGYVKKDGRLPVLKDPFYIDADNLQIISDLVNKHVTYRLPVVYVSKTSNNEDPIDVVQLAYKLKGVAHVLVQKSTDSHDKLKELCDGKNEYNGDIGIYFPRKVMGYRRYPYRNSFIMRMRLLEKVIRTVIQYSNSKQVNALYTWQGVNNALLRDRLSSQKKERAQVEEKQQKTSDELLSLQNNLDKEKAEIYRKTQEDANNYINRFLDVFEEDMQRQQRQIESLTKANEALAAENQGLRAKMDREENAPILYLGNEDEFYVNEIKEMILDAIDEKTKNIKDNGRRYDVLTDILNANDYQRVYAQKEKLIKNLFKDCKTMSSTLKQELQNLGISITEEGKHYKLTYYEDARYITSIAKTEVIIAEEKILHR